ncbi:tetratricopeptide repeat protein [Sunxiuqinia sp. A32]|uniref:tetratricopeptide repeat protein n=1 Tax=Sunxiuqinia sp. A32 TaxID=3461496 RepID=UPI00404660E9
MFRNLAILITFLLPSAIQAQNIDLMLLNQEFKKAIVIIDKKIEAKPTGELFYKRSIAHQRLMDYPAALNDITLALSVDSLNVDYYNARADLFQSLGNYENAAQDLNMALKLKPDDLLIKFDLGKILILLTDYSQAFNVFEEIHAVDSTNVMFNKYGALAAFKAKKLKRTVELYDVYLTQNPKDLGAYFNLANAFERLNRKTQSLNTYLKAMRQFPNNKSLLLKTANFTFEIKNFEFAQSLYNQYMSRYDTLLPVLLNYGICLYHNKQTEAAIEMLEMCYSNAPNDVYVNFYLGVCHKRLENYDLAANYLDFAIYISIPDFHPEMYHHLAQVYMKELEPEKAMECYKKAYELDSRKVEVLFELATMCEEFNYGKTIALNYYKSYLKEAGEEADNADYALDRVRLIKEELFMDE